MTGLCVAAGIALILLILVLSPVRIRLDINSDVQMKVWYLFFTLFRFPSDKPGRQDAAVGSEKEPKETEKKKAGFFEVLEKLKTQTGLYETVGELLEIIRSILTRFRKLLKHVVLKRTDMELTVAGDDAATTAVMYGSVCSAVYPIAAFLAECVNFKPESIAVNADFVKKNVEFRLFTDISVRIIYILIFAVSSAFYLLKLKMGEKKDERA